MTPQLKLCTHFKSILAEHGLPSTIIADCGPQYISEKFRKRCEISNITLKYSSPHHHQANSIAERTIGTVKISLEESIGRKIMSIHSIMDVQNYTIKF